MMLKSPVVKLFFLTLIFNFLTIPSLATVPRPQYWESTGVNFAYLEKNVFSRCYDSPLQLFACYQSVNEIASHLSPEASFATPAEARQEPVYYARPLRNFGAVSLFSVTPLVDSGSDYLSDQWQKKIVGARLLAVRDLMLTRHQTEVDFTNLVEALRPLAKNEAEVSGKAFNAYLKTVYDPHTYVAPKKFVEDNEKNADHQAVGLGIKYSKVRGAAVIEEVASDSSSYVAGLRVGDILTKINGIDVSQKALSETSLLIQENDLVQIDIRRAHKNLSFAVTKAPYTMVNVESRQLHDFNQDVGYVRIQTFNDNEVCDKTEKALVGLVETKVKSIILDLRGNKGGTLKNGVCVASLFVGKRVVAQVQNRADGQVEIATGPRDSIALPPLMVLVDGVTMSTAEVVALAIQDYQAGWVAGDLTFGKGTSQRRSDFNTELYFYQTGTLLLGPSGRSIQGVSLKPNFLTPPFPDANADDSFSARESDLQMHFSFRGRTEWTEPRPQLVSQLNNCRKSGALAEKLFASTESADYRLLVGEEILGCELK